MNMKIKKNILLSIISIATLLLLSCCAKKESEIKYISMGTPNEYYALKGDTYTYYNGRNTEPENGTFIVSDDKTSISFFKLDSDDTDTYMYDNNIFGASIFSINKSDVLDDGKGFDFETSYEDSKYDYEIFFKSNGSFGQVQYSKTSNTGAIWYGTYSVDGNTVKMNGKKSTGWDNEVVENVTWYYNNCTFYSSAYMLEQQE